MSKFHEARTTAYNKHLNYEHSYTEQDFKKCKKKTKYPSLYRGISFPNKHAYRNWYNEEVVSTRETKIVLRLNTITSWTPNLDVALGYAHGQTSRSSEIILLFELTDYTLSDIFCDLASNNIKGDEVLLKSGKYKVALKQHKNLERIVSTESEEESDGNSSSAESEEKFESKNEESNESEGVVNEITIGNKLFSRVKDHPINRVYTYRGKFYIMHPFTDQDEFLQRVFVYEFYKYLNIPTLPTKYYSDVSSMQFYIVEQISLSFTHLNFRNIQLGQILQICEHLLLHELVGGYVLDLDNTYNFKHIIIGEDNKFYFTHLYLKNIQHQMLEDDDVDRVEKFIRDMMIDKLFIVHFKKYMKIKNDPEEIINKIIQTIQDKGIEVTEQARSNISNQIDANIILHSHIIKERFIKYNYIEEYEILIYKDHEKNEMKLIIALENNMPPELIHSILDRRPDINQIRNKHRETALMIALRNGISDEIINRILDLKPDPNAKNNFGETALMIVLQNKKLWVYAQAFFEGMITSLLDLNPDINIKNESGETALMIALRHNLSNKIINRILDLKPDINTTNESGDTVAMIAIKRGISDEILDRILDLNPNINDEDTRGNTLLLIALRHNLSDKMINRILDLNPDINIKNESDETVLILALKNKTSERIINRILDMNPNSEDDEYRNTVLTVALLQRYTKEIIYRILDMMKPNYITNNTLKIAIKYGSKDIINHILDLHINNKDTLGNTLLMTLQHGTSDEIINRILDMNPDINIKNKSGETALMIALQNGISEGIINHILDLNPDINIKNESGDTVLMIALRYGVYYRIINRILDLKPDMNTTNKSGESAATIAIQRGISEEIINRIMHFNNNASIELLIALENKNPEQIINGILDKNPDVNVKNKFGETALMIALEYNFSDEIINRILDLKPDINLISDQSDETVLTTALRLNRSNKIINHILDMNPDINGIDSSTVAFALKNGSDDIIKRILDLNPRIDDILIVALKDEDIDEETINRILDLNPDINIMDRSGKTALAIALKRGMSKKIINRILDRNPIKK